jgi:hypothetical protein
MPQWKGIVGKSFPREDFATYLKTVTFKAWRPQFIVLHNTAVPALADWHKASGAARMKGLEHYYRDVQHWSAGPHLFIADDLIWVFTPLNTPGVHSPSWNAIAWGVELVGDYATEQFPDTVRGNAISALASLHALVGLDPHTLRLHKEDPRTTHNCPGKNIVKADIIEAIFQELSATSPGDHLPERAPLLAEAAPKPKSSVRSKTKAASKRKSR